MINWDTPEKSRLYLWILLLSFILPLATLNAEQIDAQRWKVNVGATETITGPDGVCQKVTNNSPNGLAIFVPIKTAVEWQAFLGHLPPGVTLSVCIYCGDGACNGAESCSSCPQDCGVCMCWKMVIDGCEADHGDLCGWGDCGEAGHRPQGCCGQNLCSSFDVSVGRACTPGEKCVRRACFGDCYGDQDPYNQGCTDENRTVMSCKLVPCG